MRSILLSLLLFASLNLGETNQLDETNQTSFGIEACNSYIEFENKFNCGPDGYLLGFGLSYCTRFFDSSEFLMSMLKFPIH